MASKSLVDFTPIVADLIERISGQEGKWVVHSQLVAALRETPQMQTYLQARPTEAGQAKSPDWYAGAAVAWFSRIYTAGTLPSADRFERVKLGPAWAYRRAWGPPPPLPAEDGESPPTTVRDGDPSKPCLFCGVVHSSDRCGDALVREVMVRSHAGQAIQSLDDWGRNVFGNRQKLHWKDGFSAKECARSWFGCEAGVPPEIRQLLDNDERWRGFSACTAIPERVTRLDDYGPGRHHDMVVFGRTENRRAVICVEAKAGEDFGPNIGPRIQSAITGTKLPLRANHLAQAVFGRQVLNYDSTLEKLRYQLLHALAGTAIEAATTKADLAALVVHFFPSSRKTTEESVGELTAFLKEMTGGAVSSLPEGRFTTIRLPGAGIIPPGAEVSVGWARRQG